MDEAKRILKKAARWNKVDYQQVDGVLIESIQLMDIKSDKIDPEETENETPPNKLLKDDMAKMNINMQDVKKYTVIDILKTPSLRLGTFILWYMW